MTKLSPLSTKHFDEVVKLISDRYAELHAYAPILPDRYMEYEVIAPLLESIIDNAPGVVAYDGSHLVGFISGWLLPDFRGQRAVISPEWGIGTRHENSRRIYEEMYAYAATEWVREGYNTHVVCQYADRPEDIETWHWLGFGMTAADGVRVLQLLDASPSPYTIKRAGVDDLHDVYALGCALSQHINNAPAFLYSDQPMSLEETLKLLADPNQVFWLASSENKAIGFIRHGPASDNACTIIRDPGTTSIVGAYTVPEERGKGVALSLLNQTLSWSKQHGYERCCVDFEPMNYLASRFWTRHFKTVSYALIRTIDPRLPRDL